MFVLSRSLKHLPPFKIGIVQLVQVHYIWNVYFLLLVCYLETTRDEKWCSIVPQTPQSTFWRGGQILSCYLLVYVLQHLGQ